MKLGEIHWPAIRQLDEERDNDGGPTVAPAERG